MTECKWNYSKVFSPMRYGQFSRGCLDTLAVTCQQLPLHESKCLNRQMRGWWICQRSLYKVSYRSIWQKIHTDFLKKKMEIKKSFPKRGSSSNEILSKIKLSSNQTGIRQKKPGGNAIVKEVLIIQGVMKMVSVIGSQVAEMEQRRILKKTLKS